MRYSGHWIFCVDPYSSLSTTRTVMTTLVVAMMYRRMDSSGYEVVGMEDSSGIA